MTNDYFRVVSYNGKIVAYVVYVKPKNSSKARLYSLCVDKDHQRKGIALRLMRYVEIDYNFSQVRLEVSVNNEKAIALYRKLGYKEYGYIEGYYADGSDALKMKKVVDFDVI